MRRFTLLVGTVGLLCAGAVGAIACGDDGAAIADAPDAAPDTAATSSSSSSGSTGSTSSSGSSGEGGASSSSSSSGELPSNPGQLTCGAVTCDAGATGPGPGGTFNPNACCQSATEADTKCERANNCENEGANGNLLLRCDETADCQKSGDICCYVRTGNGGNGTSFSTTCGSTQQVPFQCRSGFGGDAKNRPQLCKTSAECGDAGACNLKTCDGFKLHVCGSPDGCQ